MKLRRSKPQDNAEGRRRPASTSSPSVFSYYARGNSPSAQNTGRREESSPPRRSRPRFNLHHIPSYLAFLAVTIALLSACSLQPDPKIVLVSTTGTVHRDPAVYQQAITGIWKQSLLSRSKLTVSVGNIKRAIEAKFGEIADVQIELPLLGRRPSVVLIPAVPAIKLATGNGVFYISSEGKVMARVNDVTENELKDVPLVRDETGVVIVESGKVVLPSKEAVYLKKLSQQLMAQGLALDSITLPAAAANEADVRLAGQQYYIKFSVESDVQQSVGSYLAAKTKLDADHVVPAEYIDVRVDEKVFYK